MRDRIHHALLAALLLAPATAQNLVPNGQFHAGQAGWALVQFNDPNGTTNVGPARVAGHGPSTAVFADFQTLNSVRTATWRTNTVPLPGAPLPVGFRVSWEKQVNTPIPYASVNRVELRIRDTATSTIVYTGTQGVPNQTALIERATFTDVATIPATGNYEFEIFMRHSNLAMMPYIAQVDDVFCGGLAVDWFGQGCQGMGGIVPAITTSNVPAIGTTNFTVEVHDTMGPTAAVCLLDLSNTTWAGGALPFQLGAGCALLVGGSVALFHPITTVGFGNGVASQALTLPNDPGLAGLVLFSQWGVFDPSAGNPYGVAMSAGLQIVVQ